MAKKSSQVAGNGSGSGVVFSKKECAVTREQFRSEAKPLLVAIAGRENVAIPKEFATGSLGWFLTDKIVVVIDGVPCKVQVGLNLTIIGSKDLPPESDGNGE